MVAISSYFAQVGVKVDDKSLKEVDRFLAKVEQRLSRAVGKRGLQVNLYINEAKFHKHLQGVISRAGKGSPLKLANVTIDATKLMGSVRAVLGTSKFVAPISATISRASLSLIRTQVQAALQGIPIGVRMGAAAANPARGAQSRARASSLTGRGDPSAQEYLMGRPGRSSLSAGNRRYTDAIVGGATEGVGGNSLSGLAVRGGLGGLARVGSGSAIGRMAGMAGMAVGGPMGGAIGLAGSGVLSLAGSAFTGIWSTLGKVITLPFQAISSAASMVTGAFYKVALAALPMALGFNIINQNVKQTKSRQIALNTTAGRFGSNSETESGWLMTMANREGMSYESMIDPYTSFMASSAPALGLDKTRSVFEAFNQYGSTHGATKDSSGRALYALSQVASKGTVMSEELNQQMAEAVGFSGMKSLFAEAYQMSLGRTGEGVLKGEKGITELTDAMKKGAVKFSKISGPLEELMRRDSAAGLAEARTSSIAQQERFNNQRAEGWKRFSAGGGEGGISKFWMMMQKMGQWWQDNAASLGAMFERTVGWLNVFRLGVYEFFSFVSTGKFNSFTDWLQEMGIDVVAWKTSLANLLEAVKRLLGLSGDRDYLTQFTDRLVTFVNSLADIVDNVNRVLGGLNEIKYAVGISTPPAKVTAREKWDEEYDSSGFWARQGMRVKQTFKNLGQAIPFSPFLEKGTPDAFNGLRDVLGGTFGATYSATTGMRDLALGGQSPQSIAPSSLVPDTSWKPAGWGTNPSDMSVVRTPENPQQQVIRHDINISLSGNADIMNLIDKPLFYSEIGKAVKTERQREYSSVLPYAPKRD